MWNLYNWVSLGSMLVTELFLQLHAFLLGLNTGFDKGFGFRYTCIAYSGDNMYDGAWHMFDIAANGMGGFSLERSYFIMIKTPF